MSDIKQTLDALIAAVVDRTDALQRGDTEMGDSVTALRESLLMRYDAMASELAQAARDRAECERLTKQRDEAIDLLKRGSGYQAIAIMREQEKRIALLTKQRDEAVALLKDHRKTNTSGGWLDRRDTLLAEIDKEASDND